MYFHHAKRGWKLYKQFINSLDKSVITEMMEDNIKFLDWAFDNAICFHVDGLSSFRGASNSNWITRLFKTKSKSAGEIYFPKETQKYMRLPYPIIWLDYCISSTTEELTPEKNKMMDQLIIKELEDKLKMKIPTEALTDSRRESIKQGALVFLLENNEAIQKWTVFPFRFESDEIVPDLWKHSSFCYLITFDMTSFNKNTAIAKYPFLEGIEEMDSKQCFIDEYLDNMFFPILENTVLLLNCKNITTENHIPSEALNKKRLRSGKLPLVTYKTLILNSSINKSYENGISLGNHNRVHTCRGHFKAYTKERPLFGKYDGIWWWEYHARGQGEGVVVKDYDIKTPEQHENKITNKTPEEPEQHPRA
jgi:hypothetical protein